MTSYTNLSQLWTNSIGSISGEATDRLRSGFTSFRDRAEIVAAEIARDFPDFTVHDISHLDALWEMADLIVGSDFTLTPTEAFVLGGAFLVHDLGMAVSSLSDGVDAIRKDPLWGDILAGKRGIKFGEEPSILENVEHEEEIQVEVLAEYLRIRHAERAARIPLAEYRHNNSREYFYMIEDPELRQTFGETIGLIAQSHWFSLENVRRLFADLPPLGAPAFLRCSPAWTVDRLKLACLLRAADAAHLDARRAPGFLRALRRPHGYSDLHWKFQGAINLAQCVGDRLVFTSGRPFPIEDHEAWWVGFDLLRNCDSELRQIDALIQDLERPYRFAARSVAGAEEPARMRRYVPTRGWEPVNATVQVTNVAALVVKLGGKQLYGNDLTIPVRELIQNAADAIRARRILENRASDWGELNLAIGHDSHGEFIEVAHSGVGMSQAVLTGPFLDFGRTLWGTPMMREEFPGLASRGFVAEGKFGIGFFSVFMLGDRIKVTTRRFDASTRETRVLEFEAGLEHRPVFREASTDEYLKDGGTTVRVWGRSRPGTPNLLSTLGGWTSLSELCRWLCPTIDVNITVECRGRKERVISASDWRELESGALLKRLWVGDGYKYTAETELFISGYADRLRYLKNLSGDIVGRAGIMLDSPDETRQIRFFGERWWKSEAVVTVGGLRSSEATGHTFGVFLGVAVTASRSHARPLADDEAFAEWSSEQADLLSGLGRLPKQLESAAAYIRMCGGNTGAIPIATCRRGWISASEIVDWKECPDEILLVESGGERDYNDVNLDGHVLVVSSLRTFSFPANMDYFSDHERSESLRRTSEQEEALGWWYFNEATLAGGVMQALAKKWETTVEEIQRASEMPVEWPLSERRIGQRGSLEVVAHVRIVRRPRRA